MKREKIRITTDLDNLIPGDPFTIGDQTIIIRPLGLLKTKQIVTKIRSLFESLLEKGITFSNTKVIKTIPPNPPTEVIEPPNFKEPANLVTIAETLVSQFPEVLEEVSGIDVDDLGELPLDIIVSLLDKCVEVNLKSKEGLMGNLRSLTGKLVQLGLLEIKKPE